MVNSRIAESRRSGIRRRRDSTKTRFPDGFSLPEMIVAMGISAVLVAALTSTLHLATRTLMLSTSPTSETSQLNRLMRQWAADVRLALDFERVQASQIRFQVPDRDGDGQPETIEYRWTGAPDNSVQRILDLSADPAPGVNETLQTGISRCDFSFLIEDAGNAASVADVPGNEQLLFANDDVPDSNARPILLIVEDAASLTADETDLKTQLESWGHLIVPASHDSQSAELIYLFTYPKLIYVAVDPHANKWERVMRLARCGIVSQSDAIVDELGFGKRGPGPELQSAHWVDDQAHPATADFGLGPWDLFQSAQPVYPLTTNANKQAPDLRVLTEWPDGPALAALHVGDETFDPDVVNAQAGTSSILPQLSSLSNDFNKIFAMRTYVPTKARILSITGYLTPLKSTEVRFGIYQDDGGKIGELVRDTNKIAVTSTNWKTAEFLSELVVNPGWYWLAVGVGRDCQVHYQENSGSKSIMANWSGDLDTNLDSSLSNPQTLNWDISLHIDYEIIPTAAGRRIRLPWGEKTSVNDLNDAGLQLVRQAIDWGADPTPDDPETSLSVQDSTPAKVTITPTNFPPNATAWQLERSYVRIRRMTDDASQTVSFKLFQADANGNPGWLLQETVAIPVTQFPADRFQWFEIPFLPSAQQSNTEFLILQVETDSESPVVQVSSDPNQPADLRTYAYGRFMFPGSAP